MSYVDKVLDSDLEYAIRDPNLTLSYLHYFVDGNNVQCFVKPYYINTNGVWAVESYTHLLIPVSNVSTVYIMANNATAYAFLTNDTVTVSSTPSYATGSGRMTLSASASVNLTVPTDAQYLYLHYIVNSVQYIPAQIKLNGIDFFKTIPELLAEIVKKQNAPGYGTKMSYSYTNGDLLKVDASVSWDATRHLFYTPADAYRRRMFAIDGGVRSIKENSNSVLSDSIYYPIPIPPFATKATVSVTPSTQYFGMVVYDLIDGQYERGDVSYGWQQGTYTAEFEAGAYGYMSLCTKYDSGGTTYPVEPTEMTVVFE